MRTEQVEVIETDDGKIAIIQADPFGESDSVVHITPEQVEQFCEWLHMAKDSIESRP